MKPLVSITVPIFNKEKYLYRCIDSLINQTLNNIEILLVNDGSTDNSGAICDNYAEKDSRIRVFHKANGGSASARQVGLLNSNGFYYTVCDPDDWVELNMYEALYAKAIAEKADIVLSGLMTNYLNGKQSTTLPNEYISQEKYIMDIMLQREQVSTCCKLFNLDTIRKYKIGYEVGINLGEDKLFLFKILLYPMKITVLKEAYYHYQKYFGSDTYTNNITNITLEQYEFIYKWRVKHYNIPEYEYANIVGLIDLSFTAIRANNIDEYYYSQNFASQISIKKILRFRIFTLKSLIVIIAKLCGYNRAKRLFRLSYRYLYK